MKAIALILIVVAGLAAGFLGGMAGASLRRTPPARAPSRPVTDPARLERVEAELASIRRALERRPRPETESPKATPPMPEARPDTGDLASFDALQRKVFASQATPDESRRFWRMARTSKLLPELIARLEERVKQAPEENPLRLELARAYVARLYTVPDGPERGAWAARAEDQWREVLKRDGGHWEARYSLAFSLSQWPEFMNKRPAAIQEFEELRRVQERRAPEPRDVETYLQLGRLYRKQGQAQKAVEVFDAGLKRHPGNQALRAELEGEE